MITIHIIQLSDPQSYPKTSEKNSSISCSLESENFFILAFKIRLSAPPSGDDVGDGGAGGGLYVYELGLALSCLSQENP